MLRRDWPGEVARGKPSFIAMTPCRRKTPSAVRGWSNAAPSPRTNPVAGRCGPWETERGWQDLAYDHRRVGQTDDRHTRPRRPDRAQVRLRTGQQQVASIGRGASAVQVRFAST